MRCVKNLVVSKTTTTGTGVILIPNVAITPANLSEYRLILACNINTPTANLPLYIETTEGNAPLLCKYGNNLLANQINKRVPYKVLFGNQNSAYTDGQFVLCSCACLNGRGVESPITQSETTGETTGETTNGTTDETNNSTRKK